MCFWKFNGQSLEFTVGELAIPKIFSNVGQGVYTHEKAKMGKFGLHLVSQEAEMITKGIKNKIKGQLSAVDEELESIFVTFLSIVIM